MGAVREKDYNDLVAWVVMGDSLDKLRALLRETKTGALFQLAARYAFAHYNAGYVDQLRWDILLGEAGNEIDQRLNELEDRQAKLERLRRIASPILGE